MKTLTVDLGDRSYPIYIGQGLLEQPELFKPYIKANQVMVVTNETIAPLYLAKTLATFSGFHTQSVILPDGEEYKNLTVLNTIFDGLLTHRFDRRSTIVALGGGVIGDMAGFAASCYQRGIPFIQIPTTLLAQVDSSVGGKTGVNHVLGKNMIGTFYQPNCVVIDTETLKTLEKNQLRAGLAEIIKYGLITDKEFFDWLEKHIEKLLELDTEALSYAIARSCQDKATVVAQDERESGIRALLNLGHTFGHAIETGTFYKEFLHGEAVAIGICLAAQLSAHLGWLDATAVERIMRLIARAGLPRHIPSKLSVEQMMQLMKVDKKVRDGKVYLILMKAIGEAVVTDQYSAELFEKTIAEGRVN